MRLVISSFSLLFVLTFAEKGFSQTSAVLDFMTLETCECMNTVTGTPNRQFLESSIDACITNSVTENQDILSELNNDTLGTFDINLLDEDFGVQLGLNLVKTCPAFVDFIQKIVDEENSFEDGEESYQKLLEGNTKIQSEGCEAANQVYSSLIDNKANVPDSTITTAYNNRGYCKNILEDYYGAISDLTASLEMYPDYNLALMNRGDSKRMIGDNKGAIADYTRAINIDSASAFGAFNGRGLVYYDMEDFERSDKDYQNALKLDPASVTVYLNLGHLYGDFGKYERASEYFEKAFDLDSTLTDLSYYRAQVYINLEDYDSAISVLLSDPLTVNDEYNLTAIARSYYYLSEYKNAISYLDEAISLNSTWYYPYMFRAYAYQDSGLHRQAVSDFINTLELEDSYSEVSFYYGISLYELEKFDSAAVQFSNVISLDEDYTEAYDYRARTYMKMENIEAAIEDYTTSISQYASDDLVFKERGEAYLITGDIEKACADFGVSSALGNNEVQQLIANNCSE